MNNSKTVDKIITDIQIVNRDIDKLTSASYDALSGDSARLVVAAGVNVLSSRRRNLLERLYQELQEELGYANGYKINEVV